MIVIDTSVYRVKLRAILPPNATSVQRVIDEILAIDCLYLPYP
jgi:hypothetical protein